MTVKQPCSPAVVLFAAILALSPILSFAGEPSITLQPLGSFGSLPSTVTAPGQIVAITELADGRIAILESADNRILVFNSDGSFNSQTGGFGFGEGELRSAGDLSQVGFELWACDPLGNRIVRFDSWLAPLTPFTAPDQSSGDPLFDRPISISRSVFGDMTLVEADRGEAVMMDAEGRLIERILKFGRTGQSLVQPRRVEIANDGTVAIADPGLRAVILLDRFGNKRGVVGWPLTGAGPAGLVWSQEILWICGEGGLLAVAQDGRTLGSWPTDFLGGAANDLEVTSGCLLIAIGNQVRSWRIQRAD